MAGESNSGIFSGLLGSIVGGVASIFQNRANRKAQQEQNKFNANQALLDRTFQHAEAELARDWQEKFYTQYQSPEAMVRQYEAANLNPAMMYGGSGPSSGSVPTTVVPSGSQASASQTYFMDAMNIVEAVMKLDGLKAAIDRDKKEGYKAEQEGDKAREEAAGQQIENQFKPDLLRQDLETGKVNIENLKAGVDKLRSETDVNKDQLLNNAVQRRLQNVTADKIVEDTNKVILEQATERLKQNNIAVSTEKLAQECLLIQYQQALTALQSTLTRFSIDEKKENIANIATDTLLKQWQVEYRNTFHMEPSGSAAGVFQQLLNAIATEGNNLIQKVF